MAKSNPVRETAFEVPYPKRSGKVRDIYDLGDKLLIVATDRRSAFDFILRSAIPDKGKILTKISDFWFDHISGAVADHRVSTSVSDLPDEFAPYSSQLEGRFMLVRKAEVVPFECIVRGYLSGSGWNEYKESGSVCGQKLAEGLTESAKLPEVIFTPSTKAESGHDENISFEQMRSALGELADQIKEMSTKIFNMCSEFALTRGIIIADTKFEFGLEDGKLLLIDEVLTPDSSRFWPADLYEAGKPQPSFDKQFVRDYLLSTDWDRVSEPPVLPDDIVDKTRAKYLEALEKLTGKGLD